MGYTYMTSTQRERGSPKSRQREQNQLIYVGDKGGRGSKNQKNCGRHISIAPRTTSDKTLLAFPLWDNLLVEKCRHVTSVPHSSARRGCVTVRGRDEMQSRVTLTSAGHLLLFPLSLSIAFLRKCFLRRRRLRVPRSVSTFALVLWHFGTCLSQQPQRSLL